MDQRRTLAAAAVVVAGAVGAAAVALSGTDSAVVPATALQGRAERIAAEVADAARATSQVETPDQLASLAARTVTEVPPDGVQITAGPTDGGLYVEVRQGRGDPSMAWVCTGDPVRTSDTACSQR